MTKKRKSKKQKLIHLGRILLIIGAVLLIIGTLLYVIDQKKVVSPEIIEETDPDYNDYFNRDINEDLKSEICHDNICTNNLVIQDIKQNEGSKMEIISLNITNNSDIDLVDKHIKIKFNNSKKEVDILFSLKQNEYIEVEYQSKDYELINAKSYDFIIE